MAIVKKNEPKLIRYDAMCSAIEAAESVDEAKDIRDRAIALAAYARQAMNRDNERKCCEIRIRAERKAGELLRETAKNNQRAKPGSRGPSVGRGARPSVDQPTLKDHGISKDQSSDWQKLAEIPKKKFEEELKKPGVLSTQQVLASVNPRPKEKSPITDVDRDAMWLWGTLRDFEKVLGRNSNELYRTMTDTMQEDVARIAPEVFEWLEKLLDFVAENLPKGKKNAK